MIENIAWLTQPVPLWAFLLALLTTPTLWAKKLGSRIDPLLDRVLPTDEKPDNPVNK